MPPRQKILVVEDDQSTREALRILLERVGYRVHAAANGREALDHLHRSGPPFVVLLDLSMPVMDGWQFLQERERAPDLAPIVLVLSAEDDLAQIAVDLGASGYLAKPFEFERLLRKLRRLGGELPAA